MTITRVGVVGGGPLGQAFATILASAGIETAISNGDWREPLAALIADLNGLATATTLGKAAEEDIVLLAVPWERLLDAMSEIADWEGRILIDATDPILPGLALAELGGKTSSEVVRDLAPGAQVVKAFNSLAPERLTEPRKAGGRRVIFFSGDHLRAKGEVGRLIVQIGFAGVDLGGLAEGGRLQQPPGGRLCGLDLVRLD